MRDEPTNFSLFGPEPRAPSPQRCVSLRSLAEREGGRWRSGTAADEIEYPLPEYASAEVKDFFRQFTRVMPPASGFAILPSGRVFGAGVVISTDGDWLARDVSEDFGKPFEAHWLLGQNKLGAALRLEGRTAVVAVNHGAGYCHWLLEELPRLLSLRVGEADNVILHADTSYARRALARRAGGERVVAARRNVHFAGGPLIVPGLVAEAGRPTPAAIRAILDFTGALGLGAAAWAEAQAAIAGATGGERLFLSRAKATRRRVKNEAALWRALEARGFARVFLEDLSWEAQMALMRRARVLVAAHGAGLANAVFCASGARVIELLSRDYVAPDFWRLSALRGHDYRPVLTEGSAGLGPDGRQGSEALRVEAECNSRDLVVNVAAVLAAVNDQ